MAVINFPVGARTIGVNTPVRANGARITMTRMSWPVGALFRWEVYERERNGTLLPLAAADEIGGPAPKKDGSPGDAPLVITLSWPVDRDKDRIEIRLDVFQAFQSNVTLDWL